LLYKFVCFLVVVVKNLTCEFNIRKIKWRLLCCLIGDYPFWSLQRPLSLLPENPTKIDTKFSLYTRRNSVSLRISASSIPSEFNGNLKTKIITHGFMDHESKPWIMAMKDAILRAEDVNVIVTDWSKGNQFPYTQASSNTQVVGAEIAKLIRALAADKGAQLVNFHLIGHSLGAHISGYAGQHLNGKLGRITGLDPAGPFFEGTEPLVRLDPTDAVYVDAIHTDGTANLALGLGLMQPVAHADFYPNGGENQPGCGKTSDKILGAIFNTVTFNFDGFEDSVACSHMAVLKFFTDSIQSSCPYQSYQCNSRDDFFNGKCMQCSAKGCNRMGYWSSPSKDAGSLYLTTQTPTGTQYCKHGYSITLHSADNGGKAKGKR
jgi:pimeloyl-ACP methyl ester carboxylesterase